MSEALHSLIDPSYPTVDFTPVLDWIRQSSKVDPASEIQVGDVYSFELRGEASLHRRQFLINRSSNGLVGFERATSLAIRCGFLQELLRWLEVHRKWKDGGYFE